MATWIKLEHQKRNGDPILDTYINLDMAAQIEYNHPDDYFMISLADSEEKVVVMNTQEAYARVKAYLSSVDDQVTRNREAVSSQTSSSTTSGAGQSGQNQQARNITGSA